MSRDIKNLKPNNNSKYKQGYYIPKNPIKYSGKLPIICRSSWEYKFCVYCDNNPSIINWNSESLTIPYFNIADNKMHNYTPDFIIKIKKAEKYEITVIEIKPAAQMEKPKEPKNVNKKSIIRYKEAANVYLTNVSKMKALDLYCKERNWKIFILTEKNWKDLYTI